MKFKSILLILFIVAIVLKLFINSKPVHWIKFSKTIEESKSIDAFIAEYEVSNIRFFSDVSNEVIRKLDSLNITVWKEKEWSNKPFLIFFHPLSFTGNEVLVIENPKEYTKEVIQFRSYSRPHRANYGYSIIKEKDGRIPEQIVLKFEVNFKDTGVVTLVKKD